MKVNSFKTLVASAILGFIFIISTFNPALAQDLASPEVTTPVPDPAIYTNVELDYRLFSPEVLFHQGGDLVVMTPKEAGQPGIRFSRANLSFSYNSSFSTKAKSNGFDLSYNWSNSFVEAYHVEAKGYKVTLNPDSKDKQSLGSRNEMTGSSDGVLFLKGFDKDADFSLMTYHGIRDLERASNPLQYIYQILVDRSVFSDSTEFVPGYTVRRKERTFLIPGLGAMISESSASGYVFSSCSLGLGAIQEKMFHTTGESENKTDGAFAVSCLLNMVLQQSRTQSEIRKTRWYGGMSGNVQVMQPFDQKLLQQRMFLVSAFVGAEF